MKNIQLILLIICFGSCFSPRQISVIDDNTKNWRVLRNEEHTFLVDSVLTYRYADIFEISVIWHEDKTCYIAVSNKQRAPLLMCLSTEGNVEKDSTYTFFLGENVGIEESLCFHIFDRNETSYFDFEPSESMSNLTVSIMFINNAKEFSLSSQSLPWKTKDIFGTPELYLQMKEEARSGFSWLTIEKFPLNGTRDSVKVSIEHR